MFQEAESATDTADTAETNSAAADDADVDVIALHNMFDDDDHQEK